jgi:hypothetical protein
VLATGWPIAGRRRRWTTETNIRQATGIDALHPATRANTGAVFDLAAAVWALLVPSIAPCATPSYSHASQFISELGASGAANATLVSLVGFLPIGALVIAFLFLAGGLLPGSRVATTGVACLGLVGVAYLVSAVFPCDPGCPTTGSLSQSVHNAFGLLEYLGAASGLILLAAALRGEASWQRLSVASAISASLACVGFAGMLIPALEPVRGISQRVAELAIFGWIGFAGVFLRWRYAAVV